MQSMLIIYIPSEYKKYTVNIQWESQLIYVSIRNIYNFFCNIRLYYTTQCLLIILEIYVYNSKVNDTCFYKYIKNSMNNNKNDLHSKEKQI